MGMMIENSRGAVSQMGRRFAHNKNMTEFDPPTAYQTERVFG